MSAKAVIAVIGSGDAYGDVCDLAFEVGAGLARHGALLVCGGRGGVMQAAAHGALAAGGHTLGILPGYEREAANPYIEFAVATGMGQARNVIVVATADAVIALDGEGGTLSEIGLALKLGRPVVVLRSFAEIADQRPGVARAETAADAVELALDLARRNRAGSTSPRLED